jgi:selenocysteine-specific elongation factor
VDPETEELALLEVAELVAGSFLDGAPVITVSARSGLGIEVLKTHLLQISHKIVRGDSNLVARLPIDRSFSVKGFGAVATGTLASGDIVEGRDMEIMPVRSKVRVRGLQVHGHSVNKASAGQRVAVNLGGIDSSRITRGMVLTEIDVSEPTHILDAHVEVLGSAAHPLRSRQRVRVHMGTIEALARLQVLNEVGRIEAGDSDLVQIRLEVPVVAVPGDRFIIRSYSPQATIAGGEVIDTLAVKHRRKDFARSRQNLSDLIEAQNDTRTIEILIDAAGAKGMDRDQLQHRTGLSRHALQGAAASAVDAGLVVEAGAAYVSKKHFELLTAELLARLELFHKKNALAKGMSRELLRESVFRRSRPEIFQALVSSLAAAGTIGIDKELLWLTSNRMELSHSDSALRLAIIQRYENAGLEVPKLEEVLTDAASASSSTPQLAKRIVQMLLETGEIAKATEEFYFSKAAIDELVERLRSDAAETGDRVIDVAKFKEIAGVSRKYAIPLLEYLDRQHITARAGDKRVIL